MIHGGMGTAKPQNLAENALFNWEGDAFLESKAFGSESKLQTHKVQRGSNFTQTQSRIPVFYRQG